jgi:prepilin-type N-terminal cleavage/methylation domain-containing protein
MTRRFAPHSFRGFSLVEVLSVVGIILLLMAAVFPVGRSLHERALVLRSQVQWVAYVSALEDFRNARGHYPHFLEGKEPRALKDVARDFVDALAPFHTFGPNEIRDGLVVDAFGNHEVFVRIRQPSERTIPRESFPEDLHATIPEEGLYADVAVYSPSPDGHLPPVCSWR